MKNRKRDTDVQNRLLDSVGEGEGGMFRENSIEACILSRILLVFNLMYFFLFEDPIQFAILHLVIIYF